MRAGALGLVLLLYGECAAISFDFRFNGHLESTGEQASVTIHFFDDAGEEWECSTGSNCRIVELLADAEGYTEGGIEMYSRGPAVLRLQVNDASWLGLDWPFSDDFIHAQSAIVWGSFNCLYLVAEVDGKTQFRSVGFMVMTGSEEWIQSIDFIDIPTINGSTWERQRRLEDGSLETQTRYNRINLPVGMMIIDQFQVIHDELIGDSNVDGVFDQKDLVQVATAGRYMTGTPAAWSQGDWDADGYFDQFDMVSALGTGKYRNNSAAMAVPEPATGYHAAACALAIIGAYVLGRRTRGNHSRRRND